MDHKHILQLGKRSGIDRVAIGAWHRDDPAVPSSKNIVIGGDYVLPTDVLVDVLIDELVSCACDQRDSSQVSPEEEYDA